MHLDSVREVKQQENEIVHSASQIQSDPYPDRASPNLISNISVVGSTYNQEDSGGVDQSKSCEAKRLLSTLRGIASLRIRSINRL